MPNVTSASDDTARWVWGKYRGWATTSVAAKKFWSAARLLVVALSIAAVFVAPYAGAGAWKIASAILVAAVAFGNEQLLGPERVRAWARARGAAEGLKSEVFRYLAGGPPYRGADRDEQLVRRATAIMSSAPSAAPRQLTQEALGKGFPGPLDPSAYLERRVRDQRAYYERRSSEALRTARHFQWVGWGLKGLAAVAALLSARLPMLAQVPIDTWAAAVAALTVLLGTETTRGRYEITGKSFASTARQLEALERQYLVGARDANATAQLVDSVENAILTENAGWVADLVGEAPAQGTGAGGPAGPAASPTGT